MLLVDNWEYTQTTSSTFPDLKEEWKKCSKFPTCIHVELREEGKILDPFKDLNEWDVQWIGEADWKFRTTFSVSSTQLEEDHADLVFEGLDTYCDIYLNDQKIGFTDNMFIPHRFSCPNLHEGENELLLHFRSPWLEAKDREKANGGSSKWNGDSCRLHSRKAQYHWGWDWGPKLLTTGPWRSIKLETHSYRLEEVKVVADLIGPQYNVATLSAKATVSPSLPSTSSHRIGYTLRTLDKKVIKDDTLLVDEELKWKFSNDEVEAWWPINYGSQTLYELETKLLSKDNEVLAQKITRVGFRYVKLVQEPLENEEGSSFLFEVNGVRIFCGGSNWIPADSFLTEMTKERYYAWTKMMVDGNQNMLRVWGGGVYEDQALYDACDELGVLVWQDFMFACGLQYPSTPSFNANVKREAEAVVKRLRDHPSVVMFAGNNEDYLLAEAEGVIDYKDESGDYMNSKFPARHIYEILLPEVVKAHSSIFYWRSSPYGGKNTRDQTVGDIHQWDVWHGTQEPWSNWDKLAGRFISEFGMEGYPDLRTIKQWSDDKSQLFPQSRISVQHNKATGFERRLELYLMENFRHAFDMPSYVYYTQLMQAECLGAAYRTWRRRWRGKGREYTAGALVWQLNDCWPCVSWAIVDYYLRPKPAYFAIKRELQAYTIGMSRSDIEVPRDPTTDAFLTIRSQVELWGCNSTLSPKPVHVELSAFDLNSGPVAKISWDITLLPNSSTEIWTGEIPGQPVRTSRAQIPLPIVLHATIQDETGIIARYSYWPEPYKYLSFPDPILEVRVEGEKVNVKCEKPVKGLIFDVNGEEVRWSDQALDVFPGDERVICATGLNGREVKVRYLGDGSA
ncbi:hypothetical protein TREMEDRAFT_42399 [Tremella mesenterica DSM 1558]|uniref:uncharacterized protein n=1 Tax=Tremella mesenterica (strain ATCC 24925 / CBS 8224 / DSM 1558 / NBRC 9311 / NRRL Y-6157 / RJB 2259-6 / UBC 559-6) TaxID=578456 RepID=UPI0003F493C0|nr:uncharacterized protein TREMEDRAFT_42399 [Tremella mesenterica DSM 1558]EIW73529.1 hypothetical protein TREMEDRAFT_42399 [Tremella mesenterica DSM 1558]